LILNNLFFEKIAELIILTKMTDPRKRILLIDDSSVNNLLLQNILEEENFEVSVAFSGKEGLAIMKKVKPDLVFLDIMMPGMGGIEVLEEILSSETLKSIPVIMLTAKTDPADEKKARETGAVDYINKPVNIEKLVLKVKEILAG